MLPLPVLDDKTFEQLVEDAKKMIRQYAPGWTDHNLHDPGITLIELFAWLGEMQNYYLDRVRDDSYLKFLKLLGLRPLDAQPAKTRVTFLHSEGIGEVGYVPAGARLMAGPIPFETSDAIYITGAVIKKIVTLTSSGYQDNTQANGTDSLCYFALGEAAKQGNELCIGFDSALPAGKPVTLTFLLSGDCEDMPESGRSGKPAVFPSPKVEWEFYAGSGHKAPWVPLEIIKDGTSSLYSSGRITFKLPSGSGSPEMTGANFYWTGEKGGKYYWIRCRIREGEYELAPTVDSILLNTVPAFQGETQCETAAFSGSGRGNQVFELFSDLACEHENLVQVREEDGQWKDLDAGAYRIIRDGVPARLEFDLGRYQYCPPTGTSNVRVISYKSPLIQLISSGLPRQNFQLGGSPVVPGNFTLQVKERNDEHGWMDWIRVADFDSSGPDSRHYVLDAQTGTITFGDGLKGRVPPISRDQSCSIRVISYRHCSGAKGNADIGTITLIDSGLPVFNRLAVINLVPAVGGKDGEELAKAQTRARRELKTVTRAVTSEDFEELALSTPGLRVARAKAIPLYKPGDKEYPELKTPACVTVVVVPYSNSNKPVPGRGFLKTVCRHLDKHRLITTELFVVGPEYAEVSVYARVAYKSGFKADPDKVIEKLREFLSPLGDGRHYQGWPFGRAVYKSEIYQVIENIEGIDYVEEVEVSAEGPGLLRIGESIEIKPVSLICSGTHYIDIIQPEPELSVKAKHKNIPCENE